MQRHSIKLKEYDQKTLELCYFIGIMPFDEHKNFLKKFHDVQVLQDAIDWFIMRNYAEKVYAAIRERIEEIAYEKFAQDCANSDDFIDFDELGKYFAVANLEVQQALAQQAQSQRSQPAQPVQSTPTQSVEPQQAPQPAPAPAPAPNLFKTTSNFLELKQMLGQALLANDYFLIIHLCEQQPELMALLTNQHEERLSANAKINVFCGLVATAAIWPTVDVKLANLIALVWNMHPEIADKISQSKSGLAWLDNLTINFLVAANHPQIALHLSTFLGQINDSNLLMPLRYSFSRDAVQTREIQKRIHELHRIQAREIAAFYQNYDENTHGMFSNQAEPGAAIPSNNAAYNGIAQQENVAEFKQSQIGKRRR